MGMRIGQTAPIDAKIMDTIVDSCEAFGKKVSHVADRVNQFIKDLLNSCGFKQNSHSTDDFYGKPKSNTTRYQKSPPTSGDLGDVIGLGGLCCFLCCLKCD